jgi:RNA polymerase sigma-70 factor (ECF subfamily)
MPAAVSAWADIAAGSFTNLIVSCGQFASKRKYLCRELLMTDSDDDLASLLDRAAAGAEDALAELFTRYRKRLRQMIRLRLDHRLSSRVDPSDVLQEAYLDIVKQFPAYQCRPEMPFYLWLRLVTGQRLQRVHRRHLGAAIRDAGREVSLYHGALPEASSESLAAQLMGRMTSASEDLVRAEMQLQLQAALNNMEALDREIIALRHFEELSNAEAAEVLGLSKTAASNRYIRALARLQKVLENIPGFLDTQST